MVMPPKRVRPHSVVEAATGSRWHVDDDPARKHVSLDGYIRLPDWTPPATWGDFKPEVLDHDAMLKVWPRWKPAVTKHAEALFPMEACLITLKAMSRKFLEDEHGAIGVPGTITWVKFIYSPHMWVLNDYWTEGHRVMFDDDYRRFGGTEKVQGAAFGLDKPRGNTWGTE